MWYWIRDDDDILCTDTAPIIIEDLVPERLAILLTDLLLRPHSSKNNNNKKKVVHEFKNNCNENVL